MNVSARKRRRSTDLDTLRAMLERAGIAYESHAFEADDETPELVSLHVPTNPRAGFFVWLSFTKDGNLFEVGAWE